MISDFFQSFSAYASDIVIVFKSLGLFDIIDIAVVALILYQAARIVRETRAFQLVKSIAVIFIVYFFANEFNMISLKFLMKSVLDIGLITLVILFQPELRKALEQLGRSKFSDINVFANNQGAQSEIAAHVNEIVNIVGESCKSLSEKKTGALIVFERQIRLGDVIKSGTVIDSSPSSELVCNIFFANSPLHDGAMIIRGTRLYAAGCFLPLSSNMEIGRELGTRHRAALGMSEVSDAIVVVVSEETGAISVALDSRLQRGISVQNLKELLSAKLSSQTDENDIKPKKQAFWRVKK